MRTYGLTQFDVGGLFYSVLAFDYSQPAGIIYDTYAQVNIFTLNGNVQDLEYANGLNLIVQME